MTDKKDLDPAEEAEAAAGRLDAQCQKWSAIDRLLKAMDRVLEENHFQERIFGKKGRA